MLKNYLKIAFRSLIRSKVHSTINILGLGIGIACCILIVLYVKDEWTFDTFHSKANRIYRAWLMEDYGENEKFINTSTPFPLGQTLKENFQEIEHATYLHPVGAIVKLGDDQYSETITIVGGNFFEIFDFKVVKGSTEGALSNMASVILSKSFATKYFGDADPINKTISIQLANNFEEFSIKAVTEDVPINSSVQFDILISNLNDAKLFSNRTLTSSWFNVVPETYVLLNETADASTLVPKFKTLFKQLLGEDFEGTYDVNLQPLLDIHLNTDLPAGYAPVSNPRYSYILGGIAVLILLVACINFVTLSVGRSLKRAKEVGIRKVVGAERQHLIFQFIGEATIVTVISLLIGIVAAVIFLPLFNDLSGKKLILDVSQFTGLIAFSLVVIIGLFAGSYPAFVLSGFRPVAILKGSINVGSSKQNMRKVLVGIQLVLSIFLISSTLVMRNQLQFLQNKDLGFNKEQLMIMQLNVPGNLRFPEILKVGFEKLEQFKIELSKVPGVLQTFGASQDFGNGSWINIGYTDDQNNYKAFDLNVVDVDYIPGMEMELSMGRNFSKDNPSDQRRSIIVNEAFVKAYGWSDPLGKRIPGNNFDDHEVIGVVKDFNYNNLYTKVEPLVLVTNLEVVRSGIENIGVSSSIAPKLMTRLQPGNMSITIEEVKQVWNNLTGGEEFNYFFADQAMAAQYRNDQNLGKIISIATMLAILIGSLGLYALASLAMQNRQKEISVRKVMGATEQSLLVLLSKDYFYLIGASLLISIPITYFAMSSWLESFEYRVNIGWSVFAIAGIVSLVVAMMTISYQAIKTAWSQPAKTLKYE